MQDPPLKVSSPCYKTHKGCVATCNSKLHFLKSSQHPPSTIFWKSCCFNPTYKEKYTGANNFRIYLWAWSHLLLLYTACAQISFPAYSTTFQGVGHPASTVGFYSHVIPLDQARRGGLIRLQVDIHSYRLLVIVGLLYDQVPPSGVELSTHTQRMAHCF